MMLRFTMMQRLSMFIFYRQPTTPYEFQAMTPQWVAAVPSSFCGGGRWVTSSSGFARGINVKLKWRLTGAVTGNSWIGCSVVHSFYDVIHANPLPGSRKSDFSFFSYILEPIQQFPIFWFCEKFVFFQALFNFSGRMGMPIKARTPAYQLNNLSHRVLETWFVLRTIWKQNKIA